MTPIRLPGAFLLELEPREDVRGFFARSFYLETMHAHGLAPQFVESNTAFTHRRGTVRGLHCQVPPKSEAQLMRCVRGTIHDVIVDLRPESPTQLQHAGCQLTPDRLQLYVPEGFAHGCQNLTDDAEALYLVSLPYAPDCQRGPLHDDPVLGICRPKPAALISLKDLNWALLEPRAVPCPPPTS